jgi:hypothetical protein
MKGMKELKLLVQQLRQSRYGGEEDRRRGTGDRSNDSAPIRGHQYLSSHICFLVFMALPGSLPFSVRPLFIF